MTDSRCDDPTCTCWYPVEMRPVDRVCSGNVEVWDMTIGCPECNWQLWDWDRWAGDVCLDEATRRFEAAHPFAFDDCHDHGDEDPGIWTRYFHSEGEFDTPPGGWRFPNNTPPWHVEMGAK